MTTLESSSDSDDLASADGSDDLASSSATVGGSATSSDDLASNSATVGGSATSSATTQDASNGPTVLPEPTERPESYYVLSDGHGFVGAFYSAAAAEEKVAEYNLIPFLVQRFGVAPGPVGTIWVVLYRDIDAVAFVSNSRAEAERVQTVYNQIGLTYTDSIDYWEHPANMVSDAVNERLKSFSRAHTMYAGELSPEELMARQIKDYNKICELMQPRKDGPIARMLKENEKITIIDCVVPVNVGGAMLPADEAPAN